MRLLPRPNYAGSCALLVSWALLYSVGFILSLTSDLPQFLAKVAVWFSAHAYFTASLFLGTYLCHLCHYARSRDQASGGGQGSFTIITSLQAGAPHAVAFVSGQGALAPLHVAAALSAYLGVPALAQACQRSVLTPGLRVSALLAAVLVLGAAWTLRASPLAAAWGWDPIELIALLAFGGALLKTHAWARWAGLGSALWAVPAAARWSRYGLATSTHHLQTQDFNALVEVGVSLEELPVVNPSLTGRALGALSLLLAFTRRSSFSMPSLKGRRLPFPWDRSLLLLALVGGFSPGVLAAAACSLVAMAFAGQQARALPPLHWGALAATLCILAPLSWAQTRVDSLWPQAGWPGPQQVALCWVGVGVSWLSFAASRHGRSKAALTQPLV